MAAQETFRNLQSEVSINGQPHTVDGLLYGRSPIVFVDGRTQKGPRRVVDILRGSIEKGVLDPSLKDQNKSLTADPNDRNAPSVESMLHALTGTAFTNTSFKGGRRFFVNARILYPNNKGTYAWGNSANLPDTNKVVVISGPCLFSAPSVRAIDIYGGIHALVDPGSNGNLNRLSKIEVDDNLQPYEADSIIRHTSVISSLGNKNTEVAINLPRLEYWYYAMDAYEKGLISQSLMLEWFDKVNQRAAGISKLLQKRLPEKYKVTLTNTLGPTEDFLRESIQQGKRGLLQSALDLLRSSDTAWDHAIRKDMPFKYTDLGYMSYTIPYLQRSQDADTLLVAVENPEETKILDHVMKLLPGFADKTAILGLYPHPNLVLKDDPSHGEGKRFMYFYHPNGLLIRNLKEILAANKNGNGSANGN